MAILRGTPSLRDFRRPLGVPLPPALEGQFTDEPRWIDLRAYRDGAYTRDAKFTELAANFAAAIHGIPKEDLLSQEVRQQRRTLIVAWSTAALFLVLAGFAYWQRTIADAQRRVAVANESHALTALSRVAAENHRYTDAVKL